MNMGATGTSVLPFFEDHEGRAFADHESAAIERNGWHEVAGSLGSVVASVRMASHARNTPKVSGASAPPRDKFSNSIR